MVSSSSPLSHLPFTNEGAHSRKRFGINGNSVAERNGYGLFELLLKSEDFSDEVLFVPTPTITAREMDRLGQNLWRTNALTEAGGVMTAIPGGVARGRVAMGAEDPHHLYQLDYSFLYTASVSDKWAKLRRDVPKYTGSMGW